MVHTTTDNDKVSAASVAADSVAAGTGHVATVLVGAVTAIVMPRVLGVSHFGHWVLFRTIILLATTATLLGTRQIMSRFYAPLTVSDPLAAGRLFKVVASTRFFFSIAAGCVGYALLRHLGAPTFGQADALLLGLAIAIRATSVTGTVLLYGTTQIRHVAIVHFLMAAFVPMCVLATYLVGGFAAVPAACAVGEGLVLLVALGFIRTHIRWPKGWPEKKPLLNVLRFGAHVAPASLGVGAFVNIGVCLAAALGANESQMAFMGLAARLQSMILAGLLAVNRAILPSLSVMEERNESDRSMSWVSLLCRGGSVLIIGITGAIVLAGRPVITQVWGDAFLPALPHICLALVAALPMWIAASHDNLATVINRPDLQLRSVAWLYGGAIIVICSLPMLPPSERILLGFVAGGALWMTALILSLRRSGCICPSLYCLWGITIIGLLPVVAINHIPPSIPISVLWALAFVAAVFVFKALRINEIRRIAKRLYPCMP